jgi:putative adhesin
MPEHTFHTPLPLTLEVAIPAGDIHVETVDGEETHLVVEAEERLLENVEVRHDGNRVSVSMRGKSKIGLSFSLGSLMFGNDGVTVRASVPHGAAVQVKTASADTALAGRMRAVDVNSVSGDLRVRGEVAEDVKVKSVSGDVELEHADGALSVNSVSGDVRAGHIGGDVELRSVSGDLRVESLTAGDVRFTSVSGDVEFGIAQGSLLDVDAGSTSGDLSSEVPLASAPSEGGDGPTVTVRGKTISGDVRVFRAA